jgi:hypothetical protein
LFPKRARPISYAGVIATPDGDADGNDMAKTDNAELVGKAWGSTNGDTLMLRLAG